MFNFQCFYFLFCIFMISNSSELVGVEENYRFIVCNTHKRKNFVSTMFKLSFLGLSLYCVNKNYNDLLNGINYTGILNRLNGHKDIVCQALLWSKNFFIPSGIYGTLAYAIRVNDSINFKQKHYGKILLQKKPVGEGPKLKELDIGGAELKEINNRNYFEHDVPDWINNNMFILNYIVYKLRDGIQINSHKIKRILNFFGINGERDLYFGIKPYFYYAQNKDDYSYLCNLEYNIEEDFKKNTALEEGRLNESSNKEGDVGAKSKLLVKNEALRNNFKYKMYLSVMRVIVLNIVLCAGIWGSLVLKEYIKKYGIDGNCSIIRILAQNEWYKIIGLICSHVDWIYWSCSIVQYIIVPLLLLVTNIRLLNFYKKNILLYNINKILIKKHNLLNEYSNEINYKEKINSDIDSNIDKKNSLEDFCYWINNNFN